MHIRRYLIFLTFLISLRGFLAELLENPSPGVLRSIQDHQIKICPCVLESKLCTDAFNVSLILSPRDKDWYIINSQNLSLLEGTLSCPIGFVRTKIKEGSFAFLPNSSIVHVHRGIVFDTEMYCLQESYTHDFAANSNGRGISKLDATVCFEPPVLPLCCHEGEIMTQRNGSSVCDKSTFYTPPLNPKVVFDGEFHDWSSQGEYQSFPGCNDSVTFMPIQNNQVQRSLDFFEDGVRFFWETGSLGAVSIDQPNFCVGQITSYSSLSPAVAFCKDDYSFDKLCNNKTCFSKCCSSEYVFDLSTLSCEMDDFYYTWTPPIATDNFTMFYGMPSCSSYFPLSALDPSDEYALLDNGSLWIGSRTSLIPPAQYCIDYFRNYTHMIETVMVCFDDTTTQEGPKEISSLIYVIFMLVSSLILLITTGIFLHRVLKARESSTAVGHFHALVGEMMVFSALQLVLISLQQAFMHSLPAAACTFFATTAVVLELTAIGDVCFLCAQYIVSLVRRNSPNEKECHWMQMSFHAVPLIVSVVVVVPTQAVLLPAAPSCAIDAAMFDPWAGYPVTCTAVILLGAGVVLLCTDCLCLCWPRADQIENGDGNSRVQQERQRIQYRWWLCAKMVFIHTVYRIAYVTVWMSDSVAFWVFVDIALVLKSIFISCSLLRHHAKHHPKPTSTP